MTEYSYSPVNLVSGINYNGAKQASYLYNGTGELIEMTDWNGTTTFTRDLLNRLVKVVDHDGNVVEYGWDNVGNKTVQGYPDGTQADYYYDNENQIVEVVDPDGDITKFEYDANGNKTAAPAIRKALNGVTETARFLRDRTWMRMATSSTTAAIHLRA